MISSSRTEGQCTGNGDEGDDCIWTVFFFDIT